MVRIAIRLAIIGAIALGGLVFRDRLTSNVAELRVGDCFDLPSGISTVKDVQHHPCEESHLYEAFAELTYPGESSAPYPGSSALSSWAEDRCVSSFPQYVGVAYVSSKLGIVYLTPSADSWDHGDRVVNCILATDPPTAVSFSMKGSSR